MGGAVLPMAAFGNGGRSLNLTGMAIGGRELPSAFRLK